MYLVHISARRFARPPSHSEVGRPAFFLVVSLPRWSDDCPHNHKLRGVCAISDFSSHFSSFCAALLPQRVLKATPLSYLRGSFLIYAPSHITPILHRPFFAPKHDRLFRHVQRPAGEA